MEFLSKSWKILVLVMENALSVPNYGWMFFLYKKK